jgi:hypothetical protein
MKVTIWSSSNWLVMLGRAEEKPTYSSNQKYNCINVASRQ